MVDNYYSQHGYVSNSNLSQLQVILGERPEIGGDKQAAYDFGNLIDALITEPDLVDTVSKTVITADGTLAHFDDATFSRAMDMRRDALAHPTMSLLVKNLEFQVVVKLERFEIKTEYAHFGLPVKIKMDGLARRLQTGCDLKSTVATSQRAFYESLFFFEYDRQCAWYMDIAGLQRFWFVGVGKKKGKDGKHPIFFHPVERGDDFYNSGRAKYQRLAELYHQMIYSLDSRLISL